MSKRQINLIEWVVYFAFAILFAFVLNFNWWQSLIAMVGVALAYRLAQGFIRAPE